MVKHRWKEAKKSLRIYFGPEKEEELKTLPIENEEKREQILKLIKSINQENKEANSEKVELIKLIDEFQQQYQFLYALYANLTNEVRRVIGNKDGDSSSSDSEPYYSPYEFSGRNSPMKRIFQNNITEDAYLKDKLTSNIEVVKEPLDVDTLSSSSIVQERAEVIRGPEIGPEDESSLLREKLVESESIFLSTSKENDIYKKETAAQIKELEGQVSVMKVELEKLKTEKAQVEDQLKRTEFEAKQLQENNLQLQKQILENDKRSLEESEKVLKSEKKALEEQMTTMINDVNQSRVEKKQLQERILELEQRLKEREDTLSSQLKSFETSRKAMSVEISSLTSKINILQQELTSLRTEKSKLLLQVEKAQEESKSLITLKNQNLELSEKVEHQQKTMAEREVIMDNLIEEHKQCEGKNGDFKVNVQLLERKIEEAAQELRKQFEDNLRILSRRIRVAEQLYVEHKDWYIKTKERYEHDGKELNLCLIKLKDISMSANNMLTGLEATVPKVEEYHDHFMNRISKVSCALIFARDWVQRKNKDIMHMKEELDTLLTQLDTKESEILKLRRKVWKLENRVREGEMLVKQKEEGMLSLGEEKREAIRQLCVWIDYHRSYSDHLKLLITRISERNQRAP